MAAVPLCAERVMLRWYVISARAAFSACVSLRPLCGESPDEWRRPTGIAPSLVAFLPLAIVSCLRGAGVGR